MLNLKNSSLMKSFLSLSFLKALESISPMILVPFAIHVFSIEGFGRISFYQTLAVFFAYLIDLGFNVVGIQRITATPVVKYIKSYLAASYYIRFLLFLAIMPLFIIVSILSPIYNPGDIPLITSYTILLLSSVLSSIWYFQSKGEYKTLIIISFLSRLFFITIIVILVNDKADMVLYSLLYTLMFLLPAAIQFIIIVNGGLVLKLNLKFVYLIFKENLDISLYRFSNAVVLPSAVYTISIVASANEIGLFTVFQRILGLLVNISLPINQSLIPYLTKIKKNTKQVFYTQVLKCYYYILGLSIALVFAVYLGGAIINYYSSFIDEHNNATVLFVTSLVVLTVVPHFCNSYITQTVKLIGVPRLNKNISSITLILIGATLVLAVNLDSYITIILGYVFTYVLCFVFLSITFVKVVNNRRAK
ncbi:MAG: oligosaccharide flippase family protein [Gammaproteobacteria bacterium]|nr:oligosaccharide flippase family protein [Gammaproteobacteria bacterium]